MSEDDDDDRTRPWPPPAAPAPGDGAPKAFGGAALPAGFVLGDFEIESVLGEGGFSIVYLARDRQLRRKVALKEYLPGALARRNPDFRVAVRSDRSDETFQLGLRSFVNEARILGRFEHPALVKVLRYWEERGTAYMAMPYYEGITLKRMLRGPDFRATEAWLREILAPLLDAVELLHGDNCFHRDIAPDNILILRDGAPLLLDFGAARQVIGDSSQKLTAILKPGYAPIEQYAETATIRQGPWTDIYAISAVLYYAVTGLVPPPSVGRVMNDELTPAARLARPGYSDRFLSAIDAGLAVKPQDRPQSIAQLRRLLDLHSPSAARTPLAAVRNGAVAPPSPVAARPVPAERRRAPRPVAIVEEPAEKAKGAVPVPFLAPAQVAEEPKRNRFRNYALLLVTLVGVAVGVKYLSGLKFDLFTTLVLPSATQTAPSAPALPEAAIKTPLEPAAKVADVKPPMAASANAVAAKPPDAPTGRVTPAVSAKPAASKYCAQLLQQLSIGFDSPELRDKLESGGCLAKR